MIKYIILNLMAPGIGQMALKKYIRGVMQFAAAIFAMIWLVVVFGDEVKRCWNNAVNGGDMMMHWRPFLYPMLLLTVTWILSFADLLLFCKPPKRKAPPPLPPTNRT